MPTKHEIKNFSIDARTVIQLGRESIKNPTTALLELVKNSYDADADTVIVEVRNDYIRVSDNGSGMNQEDVENGWLRIGYSAKREEKRSRKKRRKTGEKGIGRLSADRLGQITTIKTVTKSSDPIELMIDWDLFDVEGKEVGHIPIKFIKGGSINLPHSSRSGTEIIISRPRQQWTKIEIDQLKNELESLISPFADTDFKIYFSNDYYAATESLSGQSYAEAADVEFVGRFNPSTQDLTYEIKSRSTGKKRNRTISWKLLAAFLVEARQGHADTNTLTCGRIDAKILYYSRKGFAEDFGGAINKVSLRNFLDVNAGIKIYRDSVSVKPYGYHADAAGDWLELASRKAKDPSGVSRSTFKIANHQLVGAVGIGRDANQQLRDSASREGLVENESFFHLKLLTLGCVRLIESFRHDEMLEQKKNAISNIDIVDDVEKYLAELKSLKTNLSDLQRAAESNRPMDPDKVRAVGLIIEKTAHREARVQNLLEWNRALAALATVGISTTVFGHETQNSLVILNSEIAAAQTALKLAVVDRQRVSTHLKVMDGQSKQIAAWGSFALVRMKKEKRNFQSTDIKKLVEDAIREPVRVFQEFNINVVQDIEPLKVDLYPADIESIVVNLLTNAFVFCRKNVDPKKRNIVISIKARKMDKKDGFEISVSDSGPGVAKELRELVWQPLFTTATDNRGKEIGTGLGLAIVDSIVKELHGQREIKDDEKLGGAQFNVWLPR